MTDLAHTPQELLSRLESTKQASRQLNAASPATRDAALDAIAEGLAAHAEQIVAANVLDLERGVRDGMTQGLQDRLRLTPQRVEGLVEAVKVIASLPDPLGQVVREMTLANGLEVSQVRVPFGVIGAIYEARPNVTVDITALALKSGNAVALRGGSAALETNKALVEIMHRALESVGLPAAIVASVDDYGRVGANALMKGRGLIDVLIPRGSAALIETVVTQSTVPVIETGAGVVHIFVDASADPVSTAEIVHNAKVQRPSVCNSVETVLLHREALEGVLPGMVAKLLESGVTIHADDTVCALVPDAVTATPEVWGREALSLDISLKVVDSLDEALEHIHTYSTGHTESILTSDTGNAERFVHEVDSAAVMVNASTRFTDGGEFGFGAEVGISTQKLHARGPMGLPELTSTKWIVRGNGQVRA
ncbi:glutamate-5-semialdehyde dehydrogenase [Pontimonas sp.]|nr:glutamate-5-semialdehyde dehydrogenase [Pontimonas sp.]MDA9116742.1 glutamate-5-semialdehyde dehydrogenase [Pontimonas sp.]